MITLAFGDPDLSNSEKEEKVKTLKVLIFPIPIEFQHSLHVELDNLDFSSNAPPSLVNFIEENSYFILTSCKPLKLNKSYLVIYVHIIMVKGF